MRYYFNPKKTIEFEDKFEDPYGKGCGATAAAVICIVFLLSVMLNIWFG